MNRKVIIIKDSRHEFIDDSAFKIIWNEECEISDEKSSNIFEFLEKHREAIRELFLDAIHDIAFLKHKGKTVIEHLTYGSRDSLWWYTKLGQKDFLQDSPEILEALKIIAFTNYVLSDKTNKIILVSNNFRLITSFRELCRRKNIDLVVKKNRREFFEFRLITSRSQIRSSIVAIIVTVKWLIQNLELGSRMQSATQKVHDKTRKAIFVSYLMNIDQIKAEKGDYYSNYWGHLLNEAHKSFGKINVHHQYFPTQEISSYKKARNIISLLNSSEGRIQHSMIVENLTLRIIFASFIIAVKFSFCSKILWQIISNHECSGFSVVKLLARDFGGILDFISIFREMIVYERLKMILMQDSDVDKIYYLHENQPWEHSLINLCRLYTNADIVGFVHTTVSFWNLKHFFSQHSLSSRHELHLSVADTLAVSNFPSFEVCRDVGVLEKRITMVEPVRLMKFTKESLSQSNRKHREYDFKDKHHKIVVAIFGEFGQQNNRLMWSFAQKLINRQNRDLVVLFKPHPVSNGLDTSFIGSDGVLPRIITSLNYDDVDLAVCGPTSSIYLDCIFYHLRCAILKPKNSLSYISSTEKAHLNFIADVLEFETFIKEYKDGKVHATDPRRIFQIDYNLTSWKSLFGVSAKKPPVS